MIDPQDEPAHMKERDENEKVKPCKEGEGGVVKAKRSIRHRRCRGRGVGALVYADRERCISEQKRKRAEEEAFGTTQNEVERSD